MSRLIRPYTPSEPANGPGRGGANQPAQPPDDAIGRLVKLIPVEVISGYMMLSAIANNAPTESPYRTPLSWFLIVLGLILTPIYLWITAKNSKTPPPPPRVLRWQMIISTISFGLWTYALGGPYPHGEPLLGKYPYEAWMASFVAGLFSWVVAMVWQPTVTNGSNVPPVPPVPPVPAVPPVPPM